MNAKISIAAGIFLVCTSHVHSESPYPCTTNRCNLMQIDAIACLGNGTVMNGWWGSACALGVGQFAFLCDPSWEEIITLGGCSNINTILPGLTSYPASNHYWWGSTPSRQEVAFGVDEIHTEELGRWVGRAYSQVSGNFYNCDELYSYLAANNGVWPGFTTQVGSGICPNVSWIFDCGIPSCSRPPVLATSARVSFDVAGTALVAWMIKFTAPQIPYHQMGGSERTINLLDGIFIRPNGTRIRNIKVIEGGSTSGGWNPAWGPSYLQSPAGESFTGIVLISAAPSVSQLDFNGDGRLSILDRWAQEAVLPGTTLTMNLLLDVDGNGQYDSVDQSLWPDFWTSMQNTGILACSPVDIVDTAENPGGDGMVDSSDYNSFNNAYFAQGAIADIANSAGDISRAFGGPSNGGPDGNIDEGDYNAFWNYFFLDCLR